MQRTIQLAGIAVLILSIVAIVMLGVNTGSIWVSLLITAGLFFVILSGAALPSDAQPKGAQIFIFSLLSVILPAQALWIANFQGGWWWTPIWLAIGSQILAVGIAVILRDKGLDLIGNFATVLGVLAVIFAVGGPAWLFAQLGVSPTQAPVPETEEVISGTGTQDAGATQIAGAMMTATHIAASETPIISATNTLTPTEEPTATPEATNTPETTPDAGATEIAKAMMTATARAGGESTSGEKPTATTEVEAAPAVEEHKQEGPDSTGWAGGVWTGIWGYIKSVWGILYILFIFFWVRLFYTGENLRSVSLRLVVPILASFVFLLFMEGMAFQDLYTAFTTSPVSWLKDLVLRASAEYSTVGWTIFTLGIVTTLLLTPSHLIIFRFNQQNAEKVGKGNFLDSTIARKHLEAGLNAPTRVIVATWLNLLVGGAMLISLWVALGQLSAERDIVFPFLVIPDLAFPRGKPIWHHGYFVQAAVLGLVGYVFDVLQKTSGIQVAKTKVQMVSGAVIRNFLFALVAPGGVLLFSVGRTIGLIVLNVVFLFSAGAEVKEEKPEKEEEGGEVIVIDLGDLLGSPQKGGQSGKGSLSGDGREKEEDEDQDEDPLLRPVRVVHQLTGEVVDLHVEAWGALTTNPLRGTKYYVLAEDRLSLFNGASSITDTSLPFETAMGMSVLSDQEVLVVDRLGSIVMIEDQGGSLVVGTHQRTSSKIGSYAINSFGSMLAYTHPEAGEIQGHFIQTKQDQTLAQNIKQPLQLAFASNGRYIAAGCQTGEVHIIDVAKRQVENIYQPDPAWASPVKYLFSGPDNTWVVAYEEKHIVRLSMDGALTASLELPSSALAMDVAAKGGQVAFGSRMGYIRIRSADFSQVIFKDGVCETVVRHIRMQEDGRVLLSVDKDGGVYRVNPGLSE